MVTVKKDKSLRFATPIVCTHRSYPDRIQNSLTKCKFEYGNTIEHAYINYPVTVPVIQEALLAIKKLVSG